MTVSDKQARNTLPQARMLRSKAVVAAKSAGASRDPGALPNLIARADTVMGIRAINMFGGPPASMSSRRS